MNSLSKNVAEGRASTARPSACLLLLAALLALAAALAPAAAASPLRPALTATIPGSPGVSQTPRIKGNADGVISTVVGPAARGVGPIGMDVEPGATVTIYAGDPTCLSAAAIAAVGTVEDLEGQGIEVTVGLNSITTFSATVTNDSGTSPCSTENITYRQVSGPPNPPVLSAVAPASPANDNFPRLSGSADAESTVAIYPNATCAGQPLGSGSAATFASPGIQVPVADNTTTTFSAKASWGELPSSCSVATVAYQELTPASPPPPSQPSPTPPASAGGAAAPSSAPPAPPQLRTLPGGRANDNTPLITGLAPGAAAVKIFTSPSCDGAAVAKGSAAQFAAGIEVQVADNAAVAFYGVAVGAGGGQSRCSGPVYYLEDSTIPHTRITMGPASKTRKRSAVFRFTDTTEDTPGTTFLCKVDRAKWRQCSSPLRLRRLHVRRYVLRVKAIDPAGNAETRAAIRRFKVVPPL